MGCIHWEVDHLVCMECGLAFDSVEDWRAAQETAEKEGTTSSSVPDVVDTSRLAVQVYARERNYGAESGQ
jgi:hypothetical protein